MSTRIWVETKFKIITLQHRFASDLLPTISPMVGLDGTAMDIDNQLILRAEPERMREIEAIIDKLDATKVNRRITVSNSQTSTTETSGTFRSGNVNISDTKRSQSDGGGTTFESNTSSNSQKSNQFISVIR